MKTYKTGTGLQQVTLAVDIRTFGLAASRAFVMNPMTGGAPQSVAHSNNATGDIPPADIGVAAQLAGMRLGVFASVDLIGDQEARKKESETLGGSCFLDGGADGRREFSEPDKTVSPDYAKVTLYFEIDLTA